MMVMLAAQQTAKAYESQLKSVQAYGTLKAAVVLHMITYRLRCKARGLLNRRTATAVTASVSSLLKDTGITS